MDLLNPDPDPDPGFYMIKIIKNRLNKELFCNEKMLYSTGRDIQSHGASSHPEKTFSFQINIKFLHFLLVDGH
jgi:hypothetical protein